MSENARKERGMNKASRRVKSIHQTDFSSPIEFELRWQSFQLSVESTDPRNAGKPNTSSCNTIKPIQ